MASCCCCPASKLPCLVDAGSSLAYLGIPCDVGHSLYKSKILK